MVEPGRRRLVNNVDVAAAFRLKSQTQVRSRQVSELGTFSRIGFRTL
jgi:hypothetical protein